MHTIRLSLLTLLALLCLPSLSGAQIAGYNMILVHGLHIDDVVLRPSDEEVLARLSVGQFWRDRAEGYLNWSGADRLEGGIAEMVFEQASDLSRRGVCKVGCVLVTHSTGDLVSRYFIANQEAWLTAAGLQPLNIVATLDLAGAGGGTDLADVAVLAVSGGAVTAEWIWAINMMWNIRLQDLALDQLGVIRDLATNKARSHANWPEDVPRLRFSGAGGDLMELGMGQVRTVTKTIIRGADDTVVPAHSSCGAAAPYPYESCSSSVAYDGKREWEFGPGGLMPNHYPVLMSKHYDHFQITSDTPQGKVTYVMNNFNAGLNVDFATRTKTVTAPWWDLFTETGTWQYVSGSGSTAMSVLIYNTLNN